MTTLEGKTIFITGASRGIGKAIALRAAKDGANVVITGKTSEPHPKLPGTIHSAAEEVEAAGGQALAVQMDLRDAVQVKDAVKRTVERFGGIDILINNASAIRLTDTLHTPIERADLMWQVNARGSFLASQSCLPWLLKSDWPHVLTMSPPIDLDPRWFRGHGAYTVAKYGMSMFTLGMAAEFAGRVAFNSLWPRTAIATAAVRNLLGGEASVKRSRTPEIMADAAHAVLTRDPKTTSGNFFLDDEVLLEAGVTDLDRYAVTPGEPLLTDFFVTPAAEGAAAK
jgi:citronellol/citronellal dehydrogenase